MILTPKEQEKFTEVSKPLIKWLNDNCHPHVTAIVTPGRTELFEGICSFPVDEYIKD